MQLTCQTASCIIATKMFVSKWKKNQWEYGSELYKLCISATKFLNIGQYWCKKPFMCKFPRFWYRFPVMIKRNGVQCWVKMYSKQESRLPHPPKKTVWWKKKKKVKNSKPLHKIAWNSYAAILKYFRQQDRRRCTLLQEKGDRFAAMMGTF